MNSSKPPGAPSSPGAPASPPASFSPPPRDPKAPNEPLQPKNAATILLTSTKNNQHFVLMGQRHSKHVFMPNLFVFPGGRVDPADARIQPDKPLNPHAQRLLSLHTRSSFPSSGPQSLAMAAVRETFEEVGLLLGNPLNKPRSSKNPSWNSYFQAGGNPNLSSLSFIARAVTPPGRTRRFDTRFFLAPRSQLLNPNAANNPSGELLNLQWLSLNDARKLKLPTITRIVLDIAERRLNGINEPVPFFRFHNKKMHKISLSLSIKRPPS